MPAWAVALIVLLVVALIVVLVVLRVRAAHRDGHRGMAAMRRVLGGFSSAAGVQSSVDGFTVPRLEPHDPPMVQEREIDHRDRGRDR